MLDVLKGQDLLRYIHFLGAKYKIPLWAMATLRLSRGVCLGVHMRLLRKSRALTGQHILIVMWTGKSRSTGHPSLSEDGAACMHVCLSLKAILTQARRPTTLIEPPDLDHCRLCISNNFVRDRNRVQSCLESRSIQPIIMKNQLKVNILQQIFQSKMVRESADSTNLGTGCTFTWVDIPHPSRHLSWSWKSRHPEILPHPDHKHNESEQAAGLPQWQSFLTFG